jgi:hypothetical protein
MDDPRFEHRHAIISGTIASRKLRSIVRAAVLFLACCTPYQAPVVSVPTTPSPTEAEPDSPSDSSAEALATADRVHPTLALPILFSIACPDRAVVFTRVGVAACPKPRSHEAATAWVLLGNLAFEGAFDSSALGAGIGRREDLAIAELAYTRAMVLRPSRFEPAQVRYRLAWTHYKQGRPSEALDDFLGVLDDRSVLHAEALEYAAMCFADLGGFDRSRVRKDASYLEELRLKTEAACEQDRCSR